VAGGSEDGVDGVASGAFEEAAAQVSVVFHVADHRFDSATPFEFVFDGRSLDRTTQQVKTRGKDGQI